MKNEPKASAGDPNPWESRDFIEQWSERSDRENAIRETQIRMVVLMIPGPRDEATRILDIGAGYGAVAAAILEDRPNATAVCVDASREMIRMGRERNARFAGRMEFLQGSLDASDWSASLGTPFDAVVSSRALHHLPLAQRCAVFGEIHGLLRPGGCFMNADSLKVPGDGLRAHYRNARNRWIGKAESEGEDQQTGNRLPHGPHYNGLLEEELEGLRRAGFREVDCFWKFTNYAVYGAFR